MTKTAGNVPSAESRRLVQAGGGTLPNAHPFRAGSPNTAAVRRK